MDRRNAIMAIHAEMRERKLLVNDKRSKKLLKQKAEAEAKAKIVDDLAKAEQEQFKLKQQQMMEATLRNKSAQNTQNSGHNSSHNSSQKQLNTNRFSNQHKSTTQNQLNTRIISETSSSGVHSGHSETNSDRGSNSDRGGGTPDHKNRDKTSKTNKNSSKTTKPQDHRTVREPNCSGSNSSSSFNNRTNSMVLEQRAPRIDELLSRFERAKPKPSNQPQYSRTKSSNQLKTFENDDGSYFHLPDDYNLPSDYVLPDGFRRNAVDNSSADSLGSPNSTPRLPHFETLSKLDIDNYKSGSRSSFSDSEESYSDKYNSERVAKLKQMGKTEMKAYVSMLETRRSKIEELHSHLRDRRSTMKEKEARMVEMERKLADKEFELQRRRREITKDTGDNVSGSGGSRGKRASEKNVRNHRIYDEGKTRNLSNNRRESSNSNEKDRHIRQQRRRSFNRDEDRSNPRRDPERDKHRENNNHHRNDQNGHKSRERDKHQTRHDRSDNHQKNHSRDRNRSGNRPRHREHVSKNDLNRVNHYKSREGEQIERNRESNWNRNRKKEEEDTIYQTSREKRGDHRSRDNRERKVADDYSKPRYRKPSDDRRKSRDDDYGNRGSRNQQHKQSRRKIRTSSADNLLQDRGVQNRSFQNQSFPTQNQKISKNRATIAGKTETKYEKLMRERLYGFGQINAVDC